MSTQAARFKEIKSIYNGVVPIFKPSSVSSNDIIGFINKDLNYYINDKQTIHAKSKVKMGFASPLEPFASGVLTLFLGKATQFSPAFLNSKYIYKAKVKFGELRETHCIDGPIMGKSLYSHLNEKSITREATKYLGVTKQQYPSYIFDRFIFNGDENSSEDIIEKKRLKIPQRYPFTKSHTRLVECHELKLINLSLPLAEFLIFCSGTFSVRQFVKDLSEQLKCHACLVELNRLQEGPFSLDSVTTQIYHLHYEILSKRLSCRQLIKDNECMDQFMKKILPAV